MEWLPIWGKRVLRLGDYKCIQLFYIVSCFTVAQYGGLGGNTTGLYRLRIPLYLHILFPVFVLQIFLN